MDDANFINETQMKTYRELEEELRLLNKKRSNVWFDLKKLNKEDRKFK